MPPGARQVELRSVALLLPADEAAILAYARALLHWHSRHGYCPNCGTATLVMQAGHLRHCPNCGVDQFPRTDPAVIVLVTRGEHCLLGRSQRFVPGMYSTLAGFVEPGKSLEETLYREVLEEVGVRIEQVSLPLLPALALPAVPDARLSRHHPRRRPCASTPRRSRTRAGSPATS